MVRRLGIAALGLLAVAACRHELPAAPRVVAVIEPAIATEGLAWLGPPLARMLRDRLAADDRVAVASSGEEARANVRVTCRLGHRGARLALEVEAGPTGGRATLVGRFEGESLGAVASAAGTALVERIAAGQPVRAPTPAERADMEHLGARSFVAYRHYWRAVRTLYLKAVSDGPAGNRQLEAALAADPHFVRAALARASMEASEPAARPWLERADDGAKRLPPGHPARQLAEVALQDASAGDPTARIGALVRMRPGDVDAAWAYRARLFRAGAIEQALAIDQALFARYPDLQFGANVAEDLRLLGRGEEALALARRWAELRPESPDALPTLALHQLLGGDARAAADSLGRAGLVHDLGAYEEELAVVRIAEERWDDARRHAERLTAGTPVQRTAGHYILGWIDVATGRLGEAQARFTEASRIAAAAGADAPMVPPTRAAHDLARLHGDREAAIRLAARGRADAEASQEWAFAAGFALRHALLREPADALAQASRILERLDGAERVAARAELGREAAALEGDCARLLGAGPSTSRTGDVVLYARARCLRARGEVDEARRTLERLLIPQALYDRALPSPVYAVLGRYELAELEAAAGRRDRSRHLYASFLRSWEHASPAVARPEVERARKLMAEM